MRGISNIVSMLLIILILLSLSAMLWLFTSGTINSLTRSGDQDISNVQNSLSSCIMVESIYENKIYVKNCGNGIIENKSVSLYLDDVPIQFNMTPAVISKGGIGTITTGAFSVRSGNHDLKITTPNLQTVQRVGSNYSCSADVSCVLSLDFDEGSGNVVRDSSSYHNDGFLYSGYGACPEELNSNCPIWVDGEYGSALSFDGNGDTSVQVSDSDSLDLRDNFTIEFSIKTSSYGYVYGEGGVAVGKESAYLIALWGNGSIIWALNNNNPGWNWKDTQTSIPLERWTRIDLVYDNAVIKTYKDGFLTNNYTGSGLLGTSGNMLYIGKREYGDQPFDGVIDSVRIFKRVLTQSEIENHDFANILVKK